MSIDQRVEYLEGELKKLRAKPKDAWDKLSTIAAILVPLAIAFFGNELARQMRASEDAVERHRTELEINARKMQAEREEAIARINARVSQVGVVSNFFDALVGGDVKRRKVAIRAVLIALPDDGPSLVQELADMDADTEVQAEAKQALTERAETLTAGLFSGSAAEARNSVAQLTNAAWRRSPEVVEPLINGLAENKNDEKKAAPASEVLKTLDASVVEAKRPQFETVCTQKLQLPFVAEQCIAWGIVEKKQ